MRVRRETREKIKIHILDIVLNGATNSTEEIRKRIGRSWLMTRKLMQELYEEDKVEQFKIGKMRFWSVKND